ncbi:MAG: acetylornithine deacetylase [Phycisphaerales bacterium JB059]
MGERLTERVLEHLRVLVGADTTNPPRRIGPDHPALRHAQERLEASGFRVEVRDLGDGCVNLHARRGRPSVLINCHLDTVPADGGWTGDPFDLKVKGDRAIGLGACDIKGAAACVLAACETGRGEAGVLLTTDEEAGASRCVRAFVEEGLGGYAGVIVSEPTGGRAVLEHRGIVSAEASFRGRGGHASMGVTRSALHDALRWGARAIEAAGEAEARGESWRLNIGRVEGGTKANMVASDARVVFGVRPVAGVDADGVIKTIRAAAPAEADATWTTRFSAPALGESAESRALAGRLGVEVGPGVDFWTEAALFARAGIPTLVFGPGDIAQAHAPGEFVRLGELEHVARIYEQLLGGEA